MQTEKLEQQIEFFINRLGKNYKQLRKWREKNGVECYRIYDKDIPEVPLVIDIYKNYIHAAEYRTFKVEDEDARKVWLTTLLEHAADALSIPRENVFFKFRKRQKGTEQYEKFDDTRKRTLIEENGLRFIVNLTDYLDSGLFLDHRITREMVRQESEGKRVLNLFAYTGSFSVYAASGGASSVTTVDLSNTYINWGIENFRLNSLYSGKHQFIKQDVKEYIREAIEMGEKFDIIVVDPPTFSNSKMTRDIFDIQKDHTRMLNDLLKLLRPSGKIYFSTNFTKFKIEEERINASKIKDITAMTIPMDFRNKKIHYCFLIEK